MTSPNEHERSPESRRGDSVIREKNRKDILDRSLELLRKAKEHDFTEAGSQLTASRYLTFGERISYESSDGQEESILCNRVRLSHEPKPALYGIDTIELYFPAAPFFWTDPEGQEPRCRLLFAKYNAENGGETWYAVSEDDLFWFAEGEEPPIAYDLDARGFTLSETVDGAIRATDNTDATVTLLHAMQEYRLVSQPPKQ